MVRLGKVSHKKNFGKKNTLCSASRRSHSRKALLADLEAAVGVEVEQSINFGRLADYL